MTSPLARKLTCSSQTSQPRRCDVGAKSNSRSRWHRLPRSASVRQMVVPPTTAQADPCTGAAATAQPLPEQAYQIPSPSRIAPFDRTDRTPARRHRRQRAQPQARPADGPAQAVIPKSAKSAQIEQQAAVVPTTPSKSAKAPAPPKPHRSRCGRGSAVHRPAGHVGGRLGDRTRQPQQDDGAVRDQRHRPRHHVGQRGSPQRPGADGLRRHQGLPAWSPATSGATTCCCARRTAR